MHDSSSDAKPITLRSLLETHDQPFVVIDQSLRIVAVNRAYEQSFGVARDHILEKPCHSAFQGLENPGADPDHFGSHQHFFRTLQPYLEVRAHVDAQGGLCQVRVRGYPLADADGTIYLGEALQPLIVSAEAQNRKMVGKSKTFLKLLIRLDQAAACNAAVLLQGETGKEFAAEYVHSHSARHGKPFVIADCTVLNQDLFESELFGHEKGAFTGSVGSKKGLFEIADGGTLFLDELGEMSLGVQVKLLRALETGTFRRVGGTKTLSADVRIICATNRNLLQMVKTGAFRQDLYYRVAVFPVFLPPLRERPDDIPLLSENLLEQIGAAMGKKYRLSRPALEKLMRHSFPGNIRELRNILHLGASLCQQGIITAEDIQIPEIGEEQAAIETEIPGIQSALDIELDDEDLAPLEAFEAKYIAQLLKK